MNILQNFGLKAIRFYQKSISPLAPGSCRYYPTCSNYAIDAIAVHGFFKGTAMAIWRVLRCNPFSKGGFDPVPGSELEQRSHKASK